MAEKILSRCWLDRQAQKETLFNPT